MKIFVVALIFVACAVISGEAKSAGVQTPGSNLIKLFFIIKRFTNSTQENLLFIYLKIHNYI